VHFDIAALALAWIFWECKQQSPYLHWNAYGKFVWVSCT